MHNAHICMIPQSVHKFLPIDNSHDVAAIVADDDVMKLLLFYIYCNTSKFHFQVKSNTITGRMFGRLSCAFYL